MTDAEMAAAELLDKASAEIAGSIAELIAAARDRGHEVALALLTDEITTALLASAWKLALFSAAGDRTKAAERYGAMLDSHREAVRWSMSSPKL